MSGFDESKVQTFFTKNYTEGAETQGDAEVVDVSAKSYNGGPTKVDVCRAVTTNRGTRRYNLGWMSSDTARAAAKLMIEAADKLDSAAEEEKPKKERRKGALANVGSKT